MPTAIWAYTSSGDDAERGGAVLLALAWGEPGVAGVARAAAPGAAEEQLASSPAMVAAASSAAATRAGQREPSAPVRRMTTACTLAKVGGVTAALVTQQASFYPQLPRIGRLLDQALVVRPFRMSTVLHVPIERRKFLLIAGAAGAGLAGCASPPPRSAASGSSSPASTAPAPSASVSPPGEAAIRLGPVFLPKLFRSLFNNFFNKHKISNIRYFFL